MIRPWVVVTVIGLAASSSAWATVSEDVIGPVAPWRGHARVNVDGIQADAPVRLPTGGSNWSPHWFTVPTVADARTVYLTRELTIDARAALTEASFRLSGDQAYRVWINGVLVLRGPDDPGSDVGQPPRWTHQWLYQRMDARPYLRAGPNRIAVEIVNAPVLSAYTTGQTGFAFEASLRYADGRTTHLEGPIGWVGRTASTYRVGRFADAPDLEGLRVSAAQQPDGWPEPIGSAAWAAVTPATGAWGTLRPSLIPARMEATWPAHSVDNVSGRVTRAGDVGDPATDIVVDGDAQFTVHYGRVVSAYLALQAEAPEGAIITLVPKETDDQTEIARPLEVQLREGATTWESPSYDSFSQVEVRIAHAAKPVRLRFLRAIFTSQPVQYRGSFESSDDHLNALWKAARWQTQICLQDRFLDSPNHQEPIGDPGDYLIAAAQSDYAFGDPWMAAQNLRQFAALLDKNGEITFHASYPLFWTQMLLQYYDHTGDLSLVRELAPSVHRLLTHLASYRGANGLLSEAPNYMFMDWVTLEGFNLHHPPAVIGQGYFSALYYRGLQDGARIARLVGSTQQAFAYASEASQLRDAFNAELWDPLAGLYRDGKPFQNHQPHSHYFPADRAVETHSDQVNLLAALYGLGNADRSQRLVRSLLGRDRLNVQPYFMHFAFDAEAATGQWDHAAWNQLQRWHLHPQTGTFREMWTAGDWSHSWGGTPLVQLSSRVLGVTPDAPGFTRVRIAPHTLGLAWARGTVPTPHGSVHVDWRTSDAGVTVSLSSEGAPIVFDPTFLGHFAGALTVDGEQSKLAMPGPIHLGPGAHIVTIGAMRVGQDAVQ
ncbi:alpha-L-rhamnosidase C-terminal domain-containing protein [Dyella sp.]|uniref:alpha-L-rhamnosidase-related protein n=1 Tax=Dyella sp. TaxID=1869338 RepID=UPI002ED2E8C7